MRIGSVRTLTLPALLSVALTLLPTLGCLTSPTATPIPAAAPPWLEARKVSVFAQPLGAEAQPQVGGQVGKGSGAGKGALAGAGGGALAGLRVSLETGTLAPFLAPILIPVGALVGATGGAVVGYANAIPEAKARGLKESLERSRLDLCAELAQRVAQRLPGVGRSAPAEGEAEDLRLEVSVDQWGMFGGTGSDPKADLEATVSYSVFTPDNARVLSRRFVLGGARRSFSEWNEGGENIQRQALEQLLEAAADGVVDGVFFTLEPRRGERGSPAGCGLKHLDPPATLLAGSPLHLGSPRVADLTPKLAWEALTSVPAAVEGADPQRAITEMRYDLRIWRSIGGGPGELVYERLALELSPQPAPGVAEEGATEPSGRRVEHRVEVPLLKGTEYLWAVRARYRAFGEVRTTRWSMNPEQEFHARSGSDRWLNSGPQKYSCLDEGIPPLHHHRFRTP